MADTKISAMTAATDCDNADVLPIVQAGVNNKITRAILLTAKTAQAICLQGGLTGKVQMRGQGGTALIEISGSDDIIIKSPTNLVDIQYDPFTPADWNGAVPTTLGFAIDRCAALLKVLNGGVGP